MSRVLLRLEVNGATHDVAVEPRTTLAQALREACGLTGTKVGCDLGTCGCCTVMLDGRAALSCLTLALDAEGRKITTIEGIGGGSNLHPLQEEFATCGGSQCGYCTPGFIVTSAALLSHEPSPSRERIKDAIAGNLCRCTGYVKIVEAIERGADRLRTAKTPAGEPSRTLEPSSR
jgi:aerobic carbon-monoxide dehydrogenase small subunit